jgi:hypothetical protein
MVDSGAAEQTRTEEQLGKQGSRALLTDEWYLTNRT